MKNYFLLVLLLLMGFGKLAGQPSPFQIMMKPVHIPGLPGLQSFAVGQADGKWLLVGGRTDGLHMRQPFGAFRPAGKNKFLTVVDPVRGNVWQSSLSALLPGLQDQLSSANMQFHQEGNSLYLVGGYGFSDSLNRFTTYGKLTAVDVSRTIDAIVNGKNISSFFRQISDTAFSVTGGHLKKIDDTYYLLGGQKFEGRYNPMGPDHGPGFFQQYTDQVRKFRMVDNGTTLRMEGYEVITDAAAFHRRDYNAVPQILPGGEEALTVFSGVFQTDHNIPFLNSTTVTRNEHTVNRSFAQYYNHYHSAVLPLFNNATGEMHNVFFGGIAQYYDSAGILVQNDEVPFVKTIARVTRDRHGHMAEYKLPVEMPALLGAGAEFILAPGVPHYANEVIRLDQLNTDSGFVGHVLGGIASSAPNVFFRNTGEESAASSTLFRVYVLKNNSSIPDKINTQSNNGLQLQIFPDATNDILVINFTLEEQTPVELLISNSQGRLIKKVGLKKLATGSHSVTRSLRSIVPGDIFWVTVKTSKITAMQKIIVEP